MFSAFGISFSDIGKSYEVGVPDSTTESAAATYDDMLVRAERDMFQEGYQLADCRTEWQLAEETPDGETVAVRPYRRGDAIDVGAHRVSLRLDVAAELPHPVLVGDSGNARRRGIRRCARGAFGRPARGRRQCLLPRRPAAGGTC